MYRTRKTLKNLYLGHSATITDIAFSGVNVGDPATLSSFNILFIRPEPTVWFSGEASGSLVNLDAGDVSITLTSGNGVETRTIKVNAAGLITIE
jgi:hypothetical protein